jgi:hypothetical protein
MVEEMQLPQSVSSWRSRFSRLTVSMLKDLDDSFEVLMNGSADATASTAGGDEAFWQAAKLLVGIEARPRPPLGTPISSDQPDILRIAMA